MKPGIKWPNDILYEGRKIVGILTEMSAEMEQIRHIIIGIGINVNIRDDGISRRIFATWQHRCA